MSQRAEEWLRRDVGAQFRALRVKRQLKQWEVAEEAGITESMVSLIEAGKRMPGLETMVRMAKALDATCRIVMEPKGGR